MRVSADAGLRVFASFTMLCQGPAPGTHGSHREGRLTFLKGTPAGLLENVTFCDGAINFYS